MMKKIIPIIFGAFGSPHGFTQVALDKNVPDLGQRLAALDLNANTIELNPNDKLYALRKERNEIGECLILAQYVGVLEKASDRRGAFVGAALVCLNTGADMTALLSVLNEMIESLVRKNTTPINGTKKLNVLHANELKLDPPSGFKDLLSKIQPISYIDFSEKSSGGLAVLIQDPNRDSLVSALTSSLYLLNGYSTIYFTTSNSAMQYIAKRQMLKPISDQKLTNEANEQIRRFEQRMFNLQSEIDDYIASIKSKVKYYDELHERYRKDASRTLEENQKKIEQAQQGKERMDEEVKALYAGLEQIKQRISARTKPEDISAEVNKIIVTFNKLHQSAKPITLQTLQNPPDFGVIPTIKPASKNTRWEQRSTDPYANGLSQDQENFENESHLSLLKRLFINPRTRRPLLGIIGVSIFLGLLVGGVPFLYECVFGSTPDGVQTEQVDKPKGGVYGEEEKKQAPNPRDEKQSNDSTKQKNADTDNSSTKSDPGGVRASEQTQTKEK